MSLLDTASLVITPNGTKASTLYSIVPSDGSGDMTVTRATTATRVNSAGLIESVASNVPRLDYSNGSCPSILVEPQRTNTVLYSEDFTQWSASQISSRVLVFNPLTGINNATKITKLSSSGDPYVNRNSTLSNGVCTYSVYLWTDSGQNPNVSLFIYNASVTEVNILDLVLTDVPTRYDFTVTFANTGGYVTTRIDLNPSATNQYIYAYGAQLEAGSYATSYIPTTTASVTRNADNIELLNTATLPTSYPFTIYSEAIFQANTSFSNSTFAYSFLNSAYNDNYYTVRLLNNKIEVLTRKTAEIITQSTNNFNINTFYKIAVVWTSSNVYLYVNGNLEGTSVNTITFDSNVNDILIGQLRKSFDTGSRTSIKELAVWKTQLTNTQLAQLTTI